MDDIRSDPPDVRSIPGSGEPVARGPEPDGHDHEVFFGLVSAVGTNVEMVQSALERALESVSYKSSPIRLSSLLRGIPGYGGLPGLKSPLDDYIAAHMTAGNNLREQAKRNDALALLALAEVMKVRRDAGGDNRRPLPRHAYIFRSLKHPDEVDSLRKVYGSSFYLIAAYSSHLDRRNSLAQQIARSRSLYPYDRFFEVSERLIARDADELGVGHGQKLRDTFHRADVFVDASNAEETQRSVQRFVELVFAHPFHTPTRMEYAMFHARAAALRSAELGRQVGAAIANCEGDIVAVGTNEVPKAGGGLYWPDDVPDRREFRLKQDASDEHKRRLLSDTLAHLKDAKWLSSDKDEVGPDDLADLALFGDEVRDVKPVLPSRSEVRAIIEFGRAVHAEMAALTDAARRGVSVAGCSMYVTTFPCHLCARHIVAAGIQRLYFVEPYAKSLAPELYPDSIAVETPDPRLKQVLFEPFVGIAPRQYLGLFDAPVRKNKRGSVVPFDGKSATLRYGREFQSYLNNEYIQVKRINEALRERGILP